MAAPDFVAGPVAVRRIEPVAVVALRHLAGAGAALARALDAAGIAHVPAPGQALGNGKSPGTWALWRSPSEVTLLAFERTSAAAAMTAVAADTLACAVDQTDGTLALELQGPLVDDLLRRLVDSRSWPAEEGSALRARLVDIAVVLARPQPDRVWLLADRSHEHWLASWLAYAGEALTAVRSPIP
jgi:heterotetrameric sarcosine oxidase gamma subunit